MLFALPLLAGLLTSCGTLPEDVMPPPDPLPCRSPAIPEPPPLDPVPDDTGVHLTTDEGAALYLYIRDVGRARTALLDCPAIIWSSP